MADSDTMTIQGANDDTPKGRLFNFVMHMGQKLVADGHGIFGQDGVSIVVNALMRVAAFFIRQSSATDPEKLWKDCADRAWKTAGEDLAEAIAQQSGKPN